MIQTPLLEDLVPRFLSTTHYELLGKLKEEKYLYEKVYEDAMDYASDHDWVTENNKKLNMNYENITNYDLSRIMIGILLQKIELEDEPEISILKKYFKKQ